MLEMALALAALRAGQDPDAYERAVALCVRIRRSDYAHAIADELRRSGQNGMVDDLCLRMHGAFDPEEIFALDPGPDVLAVLLSEGSAADLLWSVPGSTLYDPRILRLWRLADQTGKIEIFRASSHSRRPSRDVDVEVADWLGSVPVSELPANLWQDTVAHRSVWQLMFPRGHLAHAFRSWVERPHGSASVEPATAVMAALAGELTAVQATDIVNQLSDIPGIPRSAIVLRVLNATARGEMLTGDLTPAEVRDALAVRHRPIAGLREFIRRQSETYLQELIELLVPARNGSQFSVDAELSLAAVQLILECCDSTMRLALRVKLVRAAPRMFAHQALLADGYDPVEDLELLLAVPAESGWLDDALLDPDTSRLVYEHLAKCLGGDLSEMFSLLPGWKFDMESLVSSILTART